MSGEAWIRGPVGPDAAGRITRRGCKDVLMLVPHLVAGVRLLDVLPLLETDHRIQVVTTVSGSEENWPGAAEFAREHGGIVMPWHQAQRTRFDLVLAAARTDVDRVHGPVLTLPHGASLLKSRLRPADPASGFRPEHGLGRQHLVRDGRLVSAALALTHDDELAVLRQSCPEAVSTAVVAGDVCFDRLLASLPYRDLYRRALGVDDGRRLVVVTSTWTPQSGFGEHHDLFSRIVEGLPREDFQVVGILHPNAWTVHGRRQITAWLSEAMQAGLRMVPPEEGWRAALVAADCVIGDHGSVTQYAAGLGRPVLLAAHPRFQLRAESLAAKVAEHAELLNLRCPIRAQVDAAMASWPSHIGEVLAGALTSRQGQASGILRQLMYRILGLPEPSRRLPVSPVPLPATLSFDGRTL